MIILKKKELLSNDINNSDSNNNSSRIAVDKEKIIALINPASNERVDKVPVTEKPLIEIKPDLNTPVSEGINPDTYTPVFQSEGLTLVKPIRERFIDWCVDVFVGIPVDNGSPIDYVVDQMACDMPIYIWDDAD